MKVSAQRGFTLIELALGMVIIGLLMGGALISLMSQRETQARHETEDQLLTVRDALVGFAMANGYLPCPATLGSNGQQAPVGGGNCSQPHGYVPVRTLGLSGTVDSNGLLLDQWNSPLRYSVTQSDVGGASSADFTTPGDMRAVQMQFLNPDLQICQAVNCPAGSVISSTAPFVIFSIGKNGTRSPGRHERENIDNSDRQFCSRGYADLTSSERFDDLLLWISPQVLYHRLVTAGQLP